VGENSIMQQLDDQLTARRYIDTQFVDYAFYKQSILNKTMNDSHAKRIRVILISYIQREKGKSSWPGSGICLPRARGDMVLDWRNRSRVLGIEGRAGFGGADRSPGSREVGAVAGSLRTWRRPSAMSLPKFTRKAAAGMRSGSADYGGPAALR
jgi:hypothetical protein